MNKHEEFQKAWAKMVAKAWTDPAFKKRLMHEPIAVFKEHGIELPHGMNCKIDENTDKVIHLVIPEKPQGNLDPQHLKNAAGGGPCTWCRGE